MNTAPHKFAAGAGQHQLRKFRNRHATHCSPMQRRGTIALRPKGLGRKRPVLKNTLRKAVAAPTESGVLSRLDFWMRPGFGLGGSIVSDVVGVNRKAPARLFPCSYHHVHQMRIRAQTVVFESRKGAKTMTAVTPASRSAAPTLQPTTGNTTTTDAQAFALLEATSASALAGFYLRKGNIAAARRKAVQLLKALQVMEVTV